jgi:hypothetical protein
MGRGIANEAQHFITSVGIVNDRQKGDSPTSLI